LGLEKPVQVLPSHGVGDVRLLGSESQFQKKKHPRCGGRYFS
jgi:hypothetical protein